MIPKVTMIPPTRCVFGVLSVKGRGASVTGVMSYATRRDGQRFIVVCPVVGGCVSDRWAALVPYRSAQDRRDARRTLKREAIRLWTQATNPPTDAA